MIGKKYNLIRENKISEDKSWDTYQFSNSNTYIYVEKSLIDSVVCYDNLFYKGINLIGASFSEISHIFKKKYEFGGQIKLEDATGLYMEDSLEYYDLGLNLGVKNGIIVNAICYRFISDV